MRKFNSFDVYMSNQRRLSQFYTLNHIFWMCVAYFQKQKCAFNVFVDIISEPPLISAFEMQTQGGALAEKLTLNKVTKSEPRRDENEPLGSLSTHQKKQRNPASQVPKALTSSRKDFDRPRDLN